ncbi:MAG: IS1595 family transposase [bacterium]|nr:IS1595 family transposase [bacterium]MDE0353315.1 IS1595 family transposase [bacterium]
MAATTGIAPGKSHREGISLIQLSQLFPNEDTARKWFESIIWPDGRECPHCGSDDTYEGTHRTMPYRCRSCWKHFSVKTGTVMASSKIPLRKWAYAIYLDVTNLKGVSSMKLHRDLGVTQKTAWFMQQRIREAFGELVPDSEKMEGPLEVDEAFVGGLERNKHASKRQHLGRGPVGKTAVVGIKDRATGQVIARVVPNTEACTLQGFVEEHRVENAPVYTDGSHAYDGLPNRELVHHSVGEYVRGQAHTNGMESFWATLKRAHKGTFHRLSPKHLQRYVNEFAGRHNIRDFDTWDQMCHVAAAMVGRRLLYRDLTADTGQSSFAT